MGQPTSMGGPKSAADRPRPPGRPRDATCDGAIVTAVLEAFVEDGFDGMTVERIAERAGVGRATIYRRWPTKADLIVAAIRQRSFGNVHDPCTGDLAADIESMLTQAQAAMCAEHRIIYVLEIEMQRHPELGELFRRDFLDERRAAFRQIFSRAIDNGQLPPDADVDLLGQIGPAVIWHSLTILRRLPDPDLPRRLTKVLLGHAGMTDPEPAKRQPLPAG
jgi:AcrR family transcriptional regulator